MKIRKDKIPEYSRWPMDSTLFLAPVIAIRGIKAGSCVVYMAFWKWQLRITISL